MEYVAHQKKKKNEVWHRAVYLCCGAFPMLTIAHHVGKKRQSNSDHIEVEPKKIRVNGKKMILTVVLSSFV